MIKPSALLKTGMHFLDDNAPVLLTAFGAAGLVATAVLTAKASFKAAEVLNEDDRNRSIFEKANPGEIQPRTKLEFVKLVGPLYVSAVSVGALSCGAIIMSHRITSKRAAVLAAAYAMNQDKLEGYQEKVKEKLGVKKEKEVRDEVAQQRVTRDYKEGEVYFSPTDGKVMIREDYTGRFFWSSIEAINKAVNEVNHLVNTEGSARLSDFYECIGLAPVSTSDYFGFTRDDRLEIDWSTCTTPDGLHAVHSFEYVNHPVMNPEREADISPFR